MNWKFLIPIFVISIVFVSGCTNDKKVTGEAINDFNNIKTAGAVLEEYLSYSNYNGLLDKSIKLASQKELSTGFIFDYIENEEKYTKDLLSLIEDYKKTSKEFSRLFGDTSLVGGTDKIEKTSMECRILSQKVLEAENNFTKIEIERELIFNDTEDVEKETQKKVYLLKRNNVSDSWKVFDVIDESGNLLSKTYDLKKQKIEDKNRIRKLQELLNKLKEPINAAKEIENLENKVKGAVNSIIPNDRIIAVELGKYNNKSNEYVVSLMYYLENEWMIDNYLQFLSDSSNIFKNVFDVDYKIKQVQIIAKEKYKDDYGYTKDRYLGKTLMTRDTYIKINWNGFEYSSLDKITPVSYEGDSFYKSLKDLKESLQEWQDYSYTGGLVTIEDAPSSLCGDLITQCEEYGDCEIYEIMKSSGVCN